MTADEIHTCPRCELRFARLVELQDHLETEHPVAPEPGTSAPASRGVITVPLDPDRPPPVTLPIATVLALQTGLALDLVSAPGAALASGTDAFLRARVRNLVADGVSRVSWTVLDSPNAASGILGHLDERGSELVCMSTRSSHGLGHLVFGSVAETLARRATVPVLLAGPRAVRPKGPYHRVVACVDGSEPSERALIAAERLASVLGADLHLVEVVDPAVDLREDLMESVALQRSAQSLEVPPAGAEVLHNRQAERAIVDFLRDDPQAIVVAGTHGRTGIRSALLGSVALGVVAGSAGPVLVVPPDATVKSFLDGNHWASAL